MSAVIRAIERHARARPEAVAIESPQGEVTYLGLNHRVEQLTDCLRQRGWQSVGLLLDNGTDWALLDLAAVAAGVTMVPLPGFFSPTQIGHVIEDAGVEIVLTTSPERFPAGFSVSPERLHWSALTGGPLWALATGRKAGALSEGIAKITYTSGTTGAPKGVCLGLDAMETVAGSLAEVTAMGPADRHLSVLPLATLLENIGGVYAPLIAGSTACLYPLAEVGVSGASGLDPERLQQALSATRATTTILIPQMLQALAARVKCGPSELPALRFAAVGGAPVSRALLEQAAAVGLPAYEGYGLSEASSVVAVNTPDALRRGSVGRPLPHVEIRFEQDGEIAVRGAIYDGYLRGERHGGEWLLAGDRGYLDEDGFLHLTGRKKNMFITAFGRNVAPEWVERELTFEAPIAQAAVFGEARPWNTAVILPRPGFDTAAVEQALAAANARLPDYAQVSRWLRADAPFSLENGQLTGTGRPRREAIYRHYADRINDLYDHTVGEGENGLLRNTP